jgi:hypothetical protein
MERRACRSEGTEAKNVNSIFGACSMANDLLEVRYSNRRLQAATRHRSIVFAKKVKRIFSFHRRGTEYAEV